VKRHLVVDLSAHGFGHLAQVGPVVGTLATRDPALRVSVRTGLPASIVRPRIAAPVSVLACTGDVGMRMRSALDVDLEASLQAYLELHADWEARVAAESASLRALGADLVLADVPYLGLAAAGRAGISAVALCSLNWADVFRHYLGHHARAAGVLAQIEAAYAAAALFLQPVPHMPMPTQPRARPIGPVAARGRNRRPEIDARAGTAAGDRLVLVGLGGVATRLPVSRWPQVPGVRWIAPRDWDAARPDFLALEALRLPFLDLLASCDALFTKPGYGGFVEAGCHGVPVLYVRRPDWPEEPYLATWLSAHGLCRAVDRASVERGDFRHELEALLSADRPRAVDPTGVTEAADLIGALLRS
jgi:UDP:flavonoid glycosyltransferase YjiC (YdhE family)